jgi:hypothetical protein
MQRHANQPIIRRSPLTPDERRAMTSAVLARTSGSACQRALTLVGGQPDEPLDAQTTVLVAGHLDHCEECRAIERAIAETRVVLGTLVEIEPDDEFTAQVVAATSGRRIPARQPMWAGLSQRWAWAVALRARAAFTWDRVLARPRLSLELAYLATVLLVIIIGNPGLVADALGARTSGLLVAGDTASATAGGRQPGMATQSTGSVMPAFVERAMREVESRQASAAKGWSWFVERTSQMLSASWDWLRGLFGWIGAQTTPPAPSAQTEPAKAPVRASQ